MINPANILKIFKKEIKLYIRDKSVIFTNLFIPFIVGPFYLMFMIEVAGQISAKNQVNIKNNTIFKVSYQGEVSKNLIDALNEDKKIQVKEFGQKIEQDLIVDYRTKFKTYLDALEENYSVSKNINLALKKEQSIEVSELKTKVASARDKIEKDFNFKEVELHIAFFKGDDSSLVTYFFYSSDLPLSNAAYNYVKKFLEDFRETEFKRVLSEEKSLAQKLPAKLSFWDVNLTNPESKIFLIAGLMSTAMILMVLLTGIYMPTIKSTIGEKDSNTYKVLMMSPISPSEIFLGKLLSITFQGMVLLIPYTIEILIFYALGEKSGAFNLLSKFTAFEFLAFGIMIMSTIMICTSICFFACSFSKSTNQAQSFLSLIMFALLTPLIIILIQETQITNLSAMIPFYNLPLIIAGMLKGITTPLMFFSAIVSNFTFAFMITLLSVNAFIVQWKGRDDSSSLSDILSRKNVISSKVESSHAFLAFAVALASFLISKVLTALDIDFLFYFAFPLVFILGPSFVIFGWTKLDPFKAIKWQSNKKHNYAFYFLSFSSVMLITSILCALGLSDYWNKEYFLIFNQNSVVGVSALILLFALLPVFCEEILFRGIIFQGLRSQYSHITSSIVSTLMACVILFGAYKSLVFPVLYLVMNLIYDRSSLLACMTQSFLFRSAIIVLAILNYNNIQASTHIFIAGISLSILLTSLYFIYKRPVKKTEICPLLQEEVPQKAA